MGRNLEMARLNFEVMRRRRAPGQNLVSQLRLYSKQFQRHAAEADREMMAEVSQKAWDTMVALFNLLRGEQDAGRLAASYMNADTALLANNLTLAAKDQMILNKKIDRNHPHCGSMSLRNTLYKIAHNETTGYSYRIVGGAHYMILSGPDQNANKGSWVAEIYITKLCKSSELALKSLP